MIDDSVEPVDIVESLEQILEARKNKNSYIEEVLSILRDNDDLRRLLTLLGHLELINIEIACIGD